MHFVICINSVPFECCCKQFFVVSWSDGRSKVIYFYTTEIFNCSLVFQGVQFYHYGDDAFWEQANTDLHIDDPSVRLTDIHIETFNIENVDYLSTASASFWTTPHRNLTNSNLFSFSYVNETCEFWQSGLCSILAMAYSRIWAIPHEKWNNSKFKKIGKFLWI